MGKQSVTQRIHFIGIGGIGVSALARWFLSEGWTVSGSDLTRSALTDELKKEGVHIKIGQRKSNVPKNLSMAVFSNAITPQSPGYPEFLEAEKQIRPMSYPRTLGCLTEVYKTIAVAGSHGKSTTTALIGLILKDSPLNPTIVVGTKLKELDGKNFRRGKTNWLVLEADEYRQAFLHYHPDIAVVTNIDKEHLDVYGNLANVKKSFLQFLERTKSHGSLVLNRDDKNLFSLASQIKKIAQDRSLKIYWYSLRDKKSAEKIRKHLWLPGTHNLSNAAAAVTVAQDILKLKETNVLRKIGQYRGAWRRMEYKGELKTKSRGLKTKITVYDDYAHHPSEVAATLQAFREKFPQSKIVCVYQPHQTKRLKALYKEFLGAFAEADKLILLPTYEVVGRDSKETTFTSEKLARDIMRKNPKKQIEYTSQPGTIKKIILRSTALDPKRPRVVVMMGAGTISSYTPLLLK